jgi:5-oxoprolinase (ATP-hydrolysing) subunit A
MPIDLNADLGESFGRWTLGDDAGLMPYLTSANVAAGFHGGDPHVLRRTVELAVEHGVGIGAHTGLPDLVGFGRRRMALAPAELADLVLYQAGAVRAFADAAGAELRHVKPHGAMYSMVVDDPELAAALCETVAVLGVALLMPPQLADAAAAAGIRLVPEGYVDLDYDADGKLILERVKLARDPAETARRAVAFAREGGVESICIHGDGPNAVELAAAVRAGLAEAGVDVAPL